MEKKQITSLNELNPKKIIIGESETGTGLFIVNDIYHKHSEGRSDLKLIEINQYFTTWGMTLSSNCNEKKQFISPYNEAFAFSFYETEFTIEEVADLLLIYLK
ncbi:MAG: hypothetical protein LBO09_01830 [Candidatus Peribacteria bacterium]|jgi:hypothetical protein|nr:hypothetical protein [Candidatus Peribacteria bacterium]